MGVTILIADDEPNQLELLAFNLPKKGLSCIAPMMAMTRLKK